MQENFPVISELNLVYTDTIFTDLKDILFFLSKILFVLRDVIDYIELQLSRLLNVTRGLKIFTLFCKLRHRIITAD